MDEDESTQEASSQLLSKITQLEQELRSPNPGTQVEKLRGEATQLCESLSFSPAEISRAKAVGIPESALKLNYSGIGK